MKKISECSSKLLMVVWLSAALLIMSFSSYLPRLLLINQRELPSEILSHRNSIWNPILISLFLMMLIICVEHDIVEKVAVDGVKALALIIENLISKMLPGTKGSMGDHGTEFKPSKTSDVEGKKKGPWRMYVLPMATLMATITFQLTLIFPYYVSDASNSFIFRAFVFFTSSCFVASVCLTMHLLRGFPLKPWPQLLMLTLFGAYMWLMKAISPLAALPILFLSFPLLLIAATGKRPTGLTSAIWIILLSLEKYNSNKP